MTEVEKIKRTKPNRFLKPVRFSHIQKSEIILLDKQLSRLVQARKTIGFKTQIRLYFLCVCILLFVNLEKIINHLCHETLKPV